MTSHAEVLPAIEGQRKRLRGHTLSSSSRIETTFTCPVCSFVAAGIGPVSAQRAYERHWRSAVQVEG